MGTTGILELDDATFDAEIHRRSDPILVDFWADWCAPCKTLAPRLEELAHELSGQARIAKVDVDRNGDLLHRFGIRSVPTLIVFKRGKIVDQLIGAAPKEELRQLLRRHIDGKPREI